MEKLSGNIQVTVNEDIIKEMKEAYLACPIAVKYIKGLGIPDELVDQNISKIYTFVRDINYCKHCPGLNNCIKEDAHLCAKIVYKDGFVEKQLTPCKAVVQKLEFASQFVVRDFDPDWINIPFKSIDSSIERKKVLAKYLSFVKGDNNDWLYLTGEQNTGRSFLAAALASDIARKKKGPIAFINTSLRTKELNDYSYKNKEEFERLMNLYQTVPVLIFDDFGNEFKNDFIRDSVVFEILNKRSSSRLLTIFTSDFSIEEIVTLYSTTKASAIRAKQIGKIIKNNAKEEINLGEISIY